MEKKLELKSFKNKVVLIVNTASMCGFTKQYKGLEKFYQDYKDKGLVVLEFLQIVSNRNMERKRK